MDANGREDEAQNIQQLYDDYVVGEEVRMAHCPAGALLPALLETQVEDEDAEREDDEGACDGVSGDDKRDR